MTVQAPRAVIYGRQSRNKAKSIAEQIQAGRQVAADEGWTIAGEYEDGSSASRYAAKSREAWTRVLADIAAGRLDILILWEASRGDRTLTTWSSLLDSCRERGVRLYVIADERIYDPRKASDWKNLARAGVDSAGESDLLSVRVRRGQAGAAADGRPAHGRVPYGYRRTFDPTTGALAGQEPHPDTAPVVRRVFADLARGVAVSRVTDALTAEGVPPIAGAKGWYRQRIIDIARNPAYIGRRVHNGAEHPGQWTPLVDELTYRRVRAILADPKRVTTQPGRQKHLLSRLATCGVCDAGLEAVRGRYRCSERGCVTILQADTDEFVTEMVLTRLADPDVRAALRQLGDDADQRVTEAATEVLELRGQLDGWRQSAIEGRTTPESLAVIEAALTVKLREAERAEQRLTVPATLRPFLEPGADVRARWADAPTPARRDAIRTVATVIVDKATTPGSRSFESDRLGRSRWIGDRRTWAEQW